MLGISLLSFWLFQVYFDNKDHCYIWREILKTKDRRSQLGPVGVSARAGWAGESEPLTGQEAHVEAARREVPAPRDMPRDVCHSISIRGHRDTEDTPTLGSPVPRPGAASALDCPCSARPSQLPGLCSGTAFHQNSCHPQGRSSQILVLPPVGSAGPGGALGRRP